MHMMLSRYMRATEPQPLAGYTGLLLRDIASPPACTVNLSHPPVVAQPHPLVQAQ
jgi:hypothetical protein